jgi:ubiquinone/menaquinone biosynthesis C-methylase UbiE
MSASYDFYDYVSYWKGRSFEDNCERIALEKFFKKIRGKISLADIGGGFGRLATLYQWKFPKNLVIDPSNNLLKIGKKNFKNVKNVFFKQNSLPKLSLKDKSFDVVLLIRVAHHLKTTLPSFKEIHRILNDDGIFILEFANKIHFLSLVKAVFRLDFSFLNDLESVDRRSKESIQSKLITFSNHHPKKIYQDLKESGFEIVEVLSVSNFRSSILKNIIPNKILLWLEDKSQKTLAKFNFGPSIFVFAKKKAL